jgi:hypothetical protein
MATGLVESTVNVVSTRVAKKQQIPWTRKGTSLLLQNRTWVLNDELASRFQQWYPNSRADNSSERTLAAECFTLFMLSNIDLPCAELISHWEY